MLTQIFIITCYANICFAADYNIIWDQNYCADKDRYPSSYELPHNSPCSFCLNDVVTLRINSTSNIYENLYRVPTVTAMMNCDATTNENDNVIAFNDKQEITIRAGGSDTALSFLFRAEPYYFISTSDGTQTSAENDLTRPPNTCLQLAFTVRLNGDPSCGTYIANCNFTSVFTDPPSSLQCSEAPVSSPSSSVDPQINTRNLVITFQQFIPSPMSTVILLCVLIGIIGILIIVIPLVCIPILVLYARGEICNSNNANEVAQPYSRFKRGGSSLDVLSESKEQPDEKVCYTPPFGGQDEQVETSH